MRGPTVSREPGKVHCKQTRWSLCRAWVGDSVYAVAQQYQIPIFTIVLDNGGWQAVKSAVQRVYPKGIAAETDQFRSRLMSGRQGDRRDFSDVARAFGAYGECVTEPDELAAAIDRALAALDDGKAAVLHVHVTRL